MAQARASVIPENVRRGFALPRSGMARLVADFHREMERGLAGGAGSLRMLPAYVDIPTGSERGDFIALDLGGTNFRVLTVSLKGGGRIGGLKIAKYAIPRRLMAGSGRKLFAFLACAIKDSLKDSGYSRASGLDLGFTFSFPIRQTGIDGGKLVVWTKDFSASGVVGKDVVALLEDAMAKEGLDNIRVTALANDTVGTLMARAYSDGRCDVGVIIGTGTNACYREKVASIGKWKGDAAPGEEMIVNIEWGNFNKLCRTKYDRALDRRSDNPGQQVLEKMVSGMYLGEVARLVLEDLAAGGVLFGVSGPGRIRESRILKSEYLTEIERDRSPDMRATACVLKKIGIARPSLSDRRIVKQACRIVTARAARLAAAAIAAVVTKTDKALSRRHTVAIDGSVYEKHPAFAARARSALAELLGRKASKIRIVLSKDGSGTGAAIMAAVAAGRKS